MTEPPDHRNRIPPSLCAVTSLRARYVIHYYGLQDRVNTETAPKSNAMTPKVPAGVGPPELVFVSNINVFFSLRFKASRIGEIAGLV